jgi:hypothetical protein
MMGHGDDTAAFKKLTTTQGNAFGSAPGYYAKPFQGVLFFSDH